MNELSVIVPVYKVYEYLDECMQSIFASEYKKYNVFLVDDGTPDVCGTMCDEYALLDDRVIVLHKTNGGLSSARNSALDLIGSPYVAFVDSDDTISQEMFSTMLEEMKASEADIVCTGMKMLNNTSVQYKGWPNEKRIYYGTDALELLLDENGTGDYYQNKLYKSFLFENIRMPDGHIFEDIYTMHRVFEKSRKTVFLNSGLYNYRYNLSSITHAKKLNPNFMDFTVASERQFLFVKENHQRFYELAAKKYVRSILINIRTIFNRKTKNRYFYYEDLITRIKKLEDELISLPIEMNREVERVCRGYGYCKYYYTMKNICDKMHKHPRVQKLINKII